MSDGQAIELFIAVSMSLIGIAGLFGRYLSKRDMKRGYCNIA